MITAEITRTQLTITGHAGAGEPGHDIVCAGVSALVQAFKAGVESFTEDDVKTAVDTSTGQIQGFVWGEQVSEELKVLIDTLWLGLEMIADEYPQNVKTVTNG